MSMRENRMRHGPITEFKCSDTNPGTIQISVGMKKEIEMITRLIYVSVPANKVEKALADWKKVCAPLMVSEPGCVSEKLLRCNEEPNEFISVSEWESMEAIKTYRVGPAHQKIKAATMGITAQVVVKTYQHVG